MNYKTWFEKALAHKIAIIDMYVNDVVKHNDIATFVWSDPVVSDWDPENYDNPAADKHFKNRLIAHFKRLSPKLTITISTDYVTVSSNP